ncbi:alpha-L-arabinofuranosidase [Opitutaceae bacterium TAV1]|nr:alpha-L-arabinofuranosidase [Opitutaceae bacterium TAV1]
MRTSAPHFLRAFALATVLVIAPLHAAAPAQHQQNLITNPSFEKDSNNDGAADYWFIHPANKKAVQGFRVQMPGDESGPVPDGKCFLRISKTGGEALAVNSAISPKNLAALEQLPRDATLVLRGQIRARDLTGHARVYLQIFARKTGADRDRFVTNIVARPILNGTTDWAPVSAAFSLGKLLAPDEKLTRLEVVLGLASDTGYADIDALSLALADPNDPAAIALAAPSSSDNAPFTVRLTANPARAVSARAEIYGHNIAGRDWHGLAGAAGDKYPAILWDAAARRPDPAWDTLTHAYPLRVVRYHTGNNYDWRATVGPAAARKNKRIKASESWSGPYAADPGLDEFLRWAENLPGRPAVSLIASPFLPASDLADLVAYCNAASGPMADLRAANGHPAPYAVKHWELGNETDWEKRKDLDILRVDTDAERKDRISASGYVSLCRERIDALRAIDPALRFLAHAQTAPWSSQNPNWREWHQTVLRDLGDELDGIVIHPYYDGYSVPAAMASVDALISDIQQLHPRNRQGRPLTVVVNEHARWVDPSKKEKWSQSHSLRGAISTGDFLLHLMARPAVSMANYWAFLHRGPWSVLDADWQNPDPATRLRFGTGIHHMYQIFNDAFLPAYTLLAPLPGDDSFRAPGDTYPHTLTAGLFSDPATGDFALVAINRSATRPARLYLKGIPSPTLPSARYAVVTAESLATVNTPQNPNAVMLRHSQQNLVKEEDGSLFFELPPAAISSWRWH